MASTIVEKIMQEVRSLSPQELRELLDMINREATSRGRSRRDEILRQIRGKYAHLPTSSDQFAARKREEIELENRRLAGKEDE
jgi:hypothetical protein